VVRVLREETEMDNDTMAGIERSNDLRARFERAGRLVAALLVDAGFVGQDLETILAAVEDGMTPHFRYPFGYQVLPVDGGWVKPPSTLVRHRIVVEGTHRVVMEVELPAGSDPRAWWAEADLKTTVEFPSRDPGASVVDDFVIDDWNVVEMTVAD
jgi:hypothetical protein